MKKIEVAFEIGETAYLKNDPDQLERFVTGINIRKGFYSYALSYVTQESWHYDFEISKERNTLKTL